MDLNGVWFVVHRLEFPRPSPAPSPAAASKAAPAAQSKFRVVNAINLYKISHLKKAEAQKRRDAEAKMQQASTDAANAIVAEELKKNPPQQSAEGEVTGPKVIVPSIPRRPEDPTDRYDEAEILLLDVAMPQEIEDSLQKANKAEAGYEPTDKELALLKSSWSTLKPSGRDEYSRLEWKIIAPKFFDEGLKQDEKVRGSKLAITGTWAMIPKPGQADKNIVVYGVRKLSSTKNTGDHVRAIMANSPFPIPIDMKGNFTWYKVGELPKASSTPGPAKAGEPKEGAK